MEKLNEKYTTAVKMPIDKGDSNEGENNDDLLVKEDESIHENIDDENADGEDNANDAQKDGKNAKGKKIMNKPTGRQNRKRQLRKKDDNDAELVQNVITYTECNATKNQEGKKKVLKKTLDVTKRRRSSRKTTQTDEQKSDKEVGKGKDIIKDLNEAHQVMFRAEDLTASCSCRRFEQYGLLCRHVFNVLRFSDVFEFPRKYILRRWIREAVPNVDTLPMVGINGVPDFDYHVDVVIRDIMFSTEYVINKLVRDMENYSFRDHMKEYMSNVDATHKIVPKATRKERFAIYAGYDKITLATVRRPVGIRFKGYGSGKRMKSQREKAIIQAWKRERERKCTCC
ncbi:hypothetical protein SSX86_019808 [Deinandra increscens subsp. villosa]|uniref:SWIM-type domain-containing protein n=1 Tax=Deinandra increscens subsp. villosa TaxID=3103831 RepID=A0AAP0CTB7_9ASTR